MNFLDSLPDFGGPLDMAGLRLYPASGERDRFIYIPGGLELANREAPLSGLDFSLERIHGINPLLPPYGILDFRLRFIPFPIEALSGVAQLHPSAIVESAVFTHGALRLKCLAGTTDPTVVEFEEPVLLASNGLDSTRYIRRLSADAVNLLKDVLESRMLNFSAIAEMELPGAAAGLPVTLEFSTQALLAALRSQVEANDQVISSHLIDFWMQEPTNLPVTPLEGFDKVEKSLLAQVLADWTVAEFGVFAPSSAANVQPAFRLQPSADLPALIKWDLAQAEDRAAHRRFEELNPFEAAQQVVADQGVQAVFHDTVVPSLETGVVSLSVAANLPTALTGVLMLGVNLLAPAQPPERVQPLSATLVFKDPEAVQTVQWRFSPKEDVTFQYSAFAYIQEARGTRGLKGQTKQHTRTYLLLGVDDFPLGFVPVRADDDLLEQAIVHGDLTYPDVEDGATTVSLSFDLTAQQKVVTLVLPPEAVPQAALHLELRSLDSSAILPMGDFMARGMNLDVLNVREYGSHTAQIEVEFDDASPIVALELLPEVKQDHLDQLEVLAFTPQAPTRQFSYFSDSLFKAGYLYRKMSLPGPGDGGSAASPWSAAQSPFEALRLKTSQL